MLGPSTEVVGTCGPVGLQSMTLARVKWPPSALTEWTSSVCVLRLVVTDGLCAWVWMVGLQLVLLTVWATWPLTNMTWFLIVLWLVVLSVLSAVNLMILVLSGLPALMALLSVAVIR